MEAIGVNYPTLSACSALRVGLACGFSG